MTSLQNGRETVVYARKWPKMDRIRPPIRDKKNNNHFWLDTDCWTGNPTSKNAEFSRKSLQNSRNSPSFRNLENDDKFSEAATIGDIDDLGSIASLSSINERIQEVRFSFFETDRLMAISCPQWTGTSGQFAWVDPYRIIFRRKKLIFCNVQRESVVLNLLRIKGHHGFLP